MKADTPPVSHTGETAASAQKALPRLQSAEDLIHPRMREALSQSLSGFLEDHILSVTELLHSTDAMNSLENTDMALQAALQPHGHASRAARSG